ncbi:MAG: DUF2202 domain-containing protein [Anaerolineales bacterium]|nr:DUF2202 domain-containing protein [Anaerolineales bacterium]
MLKKFIGGGLAVGLGALLIFGSVTAVQAGSGRGGRPPAGPGTGGRAGVTQPVPGTALPAADPAGLTAAEGDGLLFMYEEEKLARDVYTALYAQWGLTTFQTISQSEQAHLDAVAVLLERYGLAAPAPVAPGAFVNADLQALYTDLMARGSQSAAEALQVGGLIEEVDLQDLGMRLAQTDQADIQQVYTNLQAGSENHLRAFARALARQTGATYQPQVLSQTEGQAILAGSPGNGAGPRGGRP